MTRGGLLTVFRKEVIDNLRDKRTLMSALFFGPLFGPVFFAIIMSMTLKLAITDSDRPLESCGYRRATRAESDQSSPAEQRRTEIPFIPDERRGTCA